MEGEDHPPQPLPPPPPGYAYVYPTRIPYSSPIVVNLAIIVSEFIAIMIEVGAWVYGFPFHIDPFLLVTLLIYYYMGLFWFVGPTLDWAFDQIGTCLDKLGRLYELELVDPFDNDDNDDEEREYVQYDEDEDFDEEVDLEDTSPNQGPHNVSFKDGVFFCRTAACCAFLIVCQVITYLEASKRSNTDAAKLREFDYLMATILLRGFYFRLARHVATLCRRQLRGENNEEGREIMLICSVVLLISLVFHYLTLLRVTDASTGGPIVKSISGSLPRNRTRPDLTQQLHHSVNSYLHVLKRRASPEIWLQNEELYLISYLGAIVLID